MTYEHQGIKYENIEAFIDFLKATAKHEVTDIEDINPYLDELDEQRAASGANSYELSSFETKSGNPELIFFDTVYTDDEESDIIGTTIIF